MKWNLCGQFKGVRSRLECVRHGEMSKMQSGYIFHETRIGDVIRYDTMRHAETRRHGASAIFAPYRGFPTRPLQYRAETLIMSCRTCVHGVNTTLKNTLSFMTIKVYRKISSRKNNCHLKNRKKSISMKIGRGMCPIESSRTYSVSKSRGAISCNYECVGQYTIGCLYGDLWGKG